MELPGTFFSPSSKNIKTPPKKISYTPGKWNFLTLIFKTFQYFLKRKLFLYFREQKLQQKFLTFWERETLKKFLIFHGTELSYISRNGNPEKLIFHEINFWAQKTNTLKKFFMFQQMKLFSLKLKKLLIFQEVENVMNKFSPKTLLDNSVHLFLSWIKKYYWYVTTLKAFFCV